MSNTTVFFKNKTAVAEFVNDRLQVSESDFPWTMTISAGKSVDCFAVIATEELSEDTALLLGKYSYEQLRIT